MRANRAVFTALLSLAVCAIGPTASSGHAQQSLGTSQVSGRVFGQDNKPVSGVNVSIFPLEAAWSGPLPIAKTDENGLYRLTIPAVGRTRVITSSESLGYPNTFFSIFASGDEDKPEVVLTPGAIRENVDIRLAKPDGRIDIAVQDGVTGEAIQGARVRIYRKDNPTMYYASDVENGVFSAVLPRKPISVVVTAPGYQSWKFVEAGSGKDYVELAPYEHKSLTAQLTPVPAAK